MGQGPEDVRVRRAWVRLLDPFARLAQLPTWPIAALIRQRVKKKGAQAGIRLHHAHGLCDGVVPHCVVDRIGGGRRLGPRRMGCGGRGGMWSLGNVGSRLFGRFNDAMHTLRDAEDGHAFWHDPQHSDVRDAWKNYLDALK